MRAVFENGKKAGRGKRRVLAGILLALLLGVTACGKEAKLYKEAVAVLKETELKLDGSNEMSGELQVAISNADYTEPKSIIFMIGDGMGYNIMEATQTVYEEELYQGKLALNYMPVQGTQTTYSMSDDVTDSAAGGTALCTGIKNTNGVVAMNKTTLEEYRTNLELAAEKGKSTGIVVTASVTDATPAAFTAHVRGRAQQEEIAAMQLEKLMDGTLDLALGAGQLYYEGEANAELLANAKAAGMAYATNWEETLEAELPLAGLYAEETLDTADASTPSLAEMTNFALEKLSQDENGFFLMVEGSQIDDYGEYNNLEREMKEMYDFDCAVAVAMRYVALHPDTVLIVTADHETGDLEIPKDASAEDILSQSTYGTTGHSSKSVPVFAAGYRAQELLGIHENTDIGIFTASLLGENDMGIAGKKTVLLDTEKKESRELLLKANPSVAEDGTQAVQVAYDGEHPDFLIPLEELSGIWQEVAYARVLSVTVENPTGETLPLPALIFSYEGVEYKVKPQKTWIKGGEKVTLGYVFPMEAWKKNMLKGVSEFVLTLEGEAGVLEYSAIQIGEYSPKLQ